VAFMTARGGLAYRARNLALLTVLLGAAGTVACGGAAANTPAPAAPATASADDDVSMSLAEHHRFHHHGGVALFIAMSLDTLGVPPERRADLVKIQSDLRAKMEPARVAEQNLMTALADGVAAANIDTAKVNADVAQVSAAAETVHDASADALNQLHALLTPAERSALVDKVQAHWSVWQKANAIESGAVPSDRGRLAKLGTELDLSPSQTSQIRTGLATATSATPRLDPKEIEAHIRAFGDAFRSETFNAHSIATGGPANAHLAGWGAATMAHFIEAASAVLRTDQRAKLADRLREHATHDPSTEASL
jgi:Spy/CpxP family protein refolding chaperone